MGRNVSGGGGCHSFFFFLRKLACSLVGLFGMHIYLSNTFRYINEIFAVG